MNLVMLVILAGVLGGIINLIVAYLKNWELLAVFTLALIFPVVGVLIIDAIYGNMGWFGAIIVFSSIMGTIGLTAISLVAMAVQALSAVEETEKVEH